MGVGIDKTWCDDSVGGIDFMAGTLGQLAYLNDTIVADTYVPLVTWVACSIVNGAIPNADI
jgi:hypothetical protein